MAANVFLPLPVTAGDGVGAWVDTSQVGPAKTISVDGSAFAGMLIIEASNDAAATAAPVDVPIIQSSQPAVYRVVNTLQFMRVRRIMSSAGPAGTPAVEIGGEVVSSNIFASLTVPPNDGVGAALSLSGGGSINTFEATGAFTGQLIIETSNDGVNFSPTLFFATQGAVGQTFVGIIAAARVRRQFSTGGPLPSVSVGSGGTASGGNVVPVLPTPATVLVACVDYDGLVLPGNDSTAALGVGLTVAAALAAAKLTPFKTYERVGELLSRFGNNAASLLVLGKPRTGGATYLKKDGVTAQDGSWRNFITAFGRVVCRPTADFVNDANDKIVCGFNVVAGTNAAGYNATAGATANVLPCQLAGGGAAGLPAEAAGSSTISGKRIRFLSTTVTAALRNVCANVYKNTAAQIQLGFNLPAVPVTGNAGDVFVIEETGLQFGSGTFRSGDATTIAIVGERYTANTSYLGFPGTLQSAACELTAGFFSGASSLFVTFTRSYNDENGTVQSVGTAGRWAGTSFNMSTTTTFSFQNGAIIAPIQFTQMLNYSNLGAGSLFVTGMNDTGSWGQPTGLASSASRGNKVLGAGNSGGQPLRITSSAAGFSGAINLNNGCYITGVDFANQTRPLIFLGVNSAASFSLASGVYLESLTSVDGGNTDVVLDTRFISGWGIMCVEASITATAAIGDIRLPTLTGLPNPLGGTFAGLANTNYWDIQNNNIVGSGGIVMQQPGKVWLNRTIAAAQGQIIRGTASGEGTIAQANTAANAAGLLGVCVTPAGINLVGLMTSVGGVAAVLFDGGGAPVAGGIAYLSTGTAGDAQSGIPALAATNQKNRLGIVYRLIGQIGHVGFEPDKLAVLADGLA